jgi:hypothetical protein
MFTTRPGVCLADDQPCASGPSPRQHYGSLFASLTAGGTGTSAAASPRAASSNNTIEKRTGSAFPGAYCHLVKRDCPELAGVG